VDLVTSLRKILFSGISLLLIVTETAVAQDHPRDIPKEIQSAAAGRALTASTARKELPTNSVAKVLVTVRTIEAQGRIEETESREPIPVRIDGRLGDLADKLKKLPFRGFVFLSADQRGVSVRKKELISLVNGQTLSLRPLYSEQVPGGTQKIGLWLRWQDRTGAEILDTRMHFDDGQSMIAGTDQAKDPLNGLILAVQVSPIPQ
jgi:hypothetical protein